jgi:hypothetical protein
LITPGLLGAIEALLREHSSVSPSKHGARGSPFPGEDGVRELHGIDLFEVSIVPHPASPDTRVLSMKSACPLDLLGSSLDPLSLEQLQAEFEAATKGIDLRPPGSDREVRVLSHKATERLRPSGTAPPQRLQRGFGEP